MSANRSAVKPLGVIAGGGDIPERVVAACKSSGKPIFVIAIEGVTAPQALQGVAGEWLYMGQVGKAIKHFKQAGVEDIVMIGRVGRPKISALHLDFTGMRLLAALARLPHQGDDEVFSTIITFFEAAGFKVVGVERVLSDMLMPTGLLTTAQPDDQARNDMYLGTKIAHHIGKLDIGQAVIVQRGMVLGVEGAEGTDRLISRCKDLHNDGPGGVLIKMKKPQQDTRVDLPCIGVSTVENAAQSNLRGIAVEASGALLIDKDAVIARANALGLFLMGVNPLETHRAGDDFE